MYGITLWGYSQNETWKPYTYLVTTSGGERPALQWLRTYMKNGPTPTAPVLLSPVNATNVARQATFVWHSSTLATTYNFQVALDDAFQLVVEDTTLADTTKTIGFALDSSTIFRWRVCGIDSAGLGLYSSTGYFLTGTLLSVKEANVSPKEFALFQNYPNPFNPVTQINYVVPQYGFVSLKVYSAIGREVATLFEGTRQPGIYTSTFDGSALGSGVYFCRMMATNFNATRKLVLIK